jgi:DNA-binding winged helix-turn-helix (wHTH) protein/TolB-like protein
MVYTFGPFRYDAAQRLLFRGSELVALAPKTLDTLHALLERRGQVVEKAELMKLVWPDTHVEEIGLARNISLLRKALGDDSDRNPYIETIPRRGYRFAAEVAGAPEVAGGELPRPAPQPRRRVFLLVAGVLTLAALAYYQFYVPSRYAARPAGTAGLAVIPFECRCPGMDGENFSAAFNELLVAGLSRLEGVQVVSPATVRRYRNLRVSTAVMGRLLGLDLLLEGSVVRFDERLRIAVRLADVRTGRLVWAESYDQPAADLAAAQEAVARAVATEAGKRLRPL